LSLYRGDGDGNEVAVTGIQEAAAGARGISPGSIAGKQKQTIALTKLGVWLDFPPSRR
jgi:hypothetical protein